MSLYTEAEATHQAVSVSLGALRARRFRARRKDGIRVASIRFSWQAIAALIEGGFLPAAESQDTAAIERAIYALLNAWRERGMLTRPAPHAR